MKLVLLAVAVLTLAVGCSKKEAATPGDGDGDSGAAKKQPQRSFDPFLSSPQKRISALETSKENAARSGTNTPNPEIKGREASVADGILGMEDSDVRNLAMVQRISQWAEADIDAVMAFGNAIENDLTMKRAFHRSDTYSRLAASWQLAGATDTVESLLESPDLSPGERAAVEAALQSEEP